MARKFTSKKLKEIRSYLAALSPDEKLDALKVLYCDKFYQVRTLAAKLQATPSYANHDKINKLYTIRQRITEQSGSNHHVDHVVPLQGKSVCGLHVEDNLRIIQAVVNLKKNNKFNPGSI